MPRFAVRSRNTSVVFVKIHSKKFTVKQCSIQESSCFYMIFIIAGRYECDSR